MLRRRRTITSVEDSVQFLSALGSATDSGLFSFMPVSSSATHQLVAAEFQRRGRDAAGRCRPPTESPDAAAPWRGSPADTAAARLAAGTGTRVAGAAAIASPPP